MKKSILFISCEEAHRICDKSQYNEATFLERVKLNLRLCWCKITRAYTKRNNALTNAVKASNVDCLKKSEREDLNKSFKNHLNNHQ